VQLLEPLRRLLPGHQVDHVQGLGWKGKPDHFLLADAAARGYDVLVTNDSGQMDSPKECRDIRDSGIHHTGYRMLDGLDGLALAMGAVLAGQPADRQGVGERGRTAARSRAGNRPRDATPRLIPLSTCRGAGQRELGSASDRALSAQGTLECLPSIRPNGWARARGRACRQPARSPPRSV
jgi:hypothetical protein